MTAAGAATVPFAAGLIAATFGSRDAVMPCRVGLPEIVDERATFEMTTRGGVELRITIEEIR